ncbi:chymotrypsinogen B-like [Aethina tumida]|uniref:chymotrypsinogen B-like n=1 Tax=Aethina tumida TaxID=116153 RepID=UPI002148FD18|nr:chymotrypsinogen B-like [Aethina tumida]
MYVTALGWGLTLFTGPKADTLQKVTLQVVNNTYCQKSHNVEVPPTEICTYSSGKDTCTFDSGGPLAWFDSHNRRWKLVGIPSSGIGCATTLPSINTRVTSYLPWIRINSKGAYLD